MTPDEARKTLHILPAEALSQQPRKCVHYTDHVSPACLKDVPYVQVTIQGPFRYRYESEPARFKDHKSKVAVPCQEGHDFGCVTCPHREMKD